MRLQVRYVHVGREQLCLTEVTKGKKKITWSGKEFKI
jgi:hypothetical protein